MSLVVLWREFWDDYVGERAEGIIKDILCRVRKEDPVIGHWVVADINKGVMPIA